MTENYQAIRSRAEAQVATAHPTDRVRILIGLGTCGMAAGGKAVLAALEEKLAREGIEADVIRVG